MESRQSVIVFSALYAGIITLTNGFIFNEVKRIDNYLYDLNSDKISGKHIK